jgi:hypothetical protein
MSSVVPGAPTISWARWNTYTEMVMAWAAAPAGDSVTTDYQVMATSDGGAVVTMDAGTTLEAALSNMDSTPDWTIQVRAQDAAGWGPWSAPVLVGGL